MTAEAIEITPLSRPRLEFNRAMGGKLRAKIYEAVYQVPFFIKRGSGYN